MQAELLAVDLMIEIVQALVQPGGEHDLLVAAGDGVRLGSSVSTPAEDPSVLITRDEIATMNLAHRDDGRLSVPACAVVLLLVRQRHAQGRVTFARPPAVPTPRPAEADGLLPVS